MSDNFVIQVSRTERILVQMVPAPGPRGPAGTIAIGTVQTTGPDTPASITNTGTPTAAVLNFSIPVTPFGNVDGGNASSVYGGTTPVDGGGV